MKLVCQSCKNDTFIQESMYTVKEEVRLFSEKGKIKVVVDKLLDVDEDMIEHINTYICTACKTKHVIVTDENGKERIVIENG